MKFLPGWLFLIVMSGFFILIADDGQTLAPSPSEEGPSFHEASNNPRNEEVRGKSHVPVKKVVLLLFPYQSYLPQTVMATQSILDAFNKAGDLEMELYFEYMDLNRIQGPEYRQQLASLFSTKYRRKNVDLVMATAEPSLDFWLTHRVDILPNVPVVFYDITHEDLKGRTFPPDVTGIGAEVSYIPALNWILQARPSVDEVILVQGAGEADRVFAVSPADLKEDLVRPVKVTDWSQLPLSEIKRRARGLPATAVILCHLMFEDAAGLKYLPIDVVRGLAAVSAVPVISGYSQFVGTGSIGGYVYGIEQEAEKACRIGLQILRGASVATTPVVSESKNRFVFDHSALKRHGISLSELPAGSLIKNRQYTLWELHRLKVIGMAVAFFVLGAIILLLAGLNRKLNLARLDLSRLNEDLEAKVSRRTADLNQTNRQLEMEIAERVKAAEDLKASEAKYRLLAENMIDVVWTMSPSGEFTYVSPSVKNLRGYTPEEVLRQSLTEALTLESLEKVRASMNETIPLAMKGSNSFRSKPTLHELEQPCKDGTIVWTEVVAKAVFDDHGSFIGFQGLTRDISERKAAEAERERLITKLQAALGRVKQIEGILPICSFCKMIRDEAGEWHVLESYISHHSEARFSHGLCPECARKHYPDFFPE